jgi:hypothetical protein
MVPVTHRLSASIISAMTVPKRAAVAKSHIELDLATQRQFLLSDRKERLRHFSTVIGAKWIRPDRAGAIGVVI